MRSLDAEEIQPAGRSHTATRTSDQLAMIAALLIAVLAPARGLPKGKYFKIVDAQVKVTRAATPIAPAKKVDVEKKDSLTELSEQLPALRNQVKTVEAENQRLQAEKGKRPMQIVYGDRKRIRC